METSFSSSQSTTLNASPERKGKLEGKQSPVQQQIKQLKEQMEIQIKVIEAAEERTRRKTTKCNRLFGKIDGYTAAQLKYQNCSRSKIIDMDNLVQDMQSNPEVSKTNLLKQMCDENKQLLSRLNELAGKVKETQVKFSSSFNKRNQAEGKAQSAKVQLLEIQNKINELESH